MRYLLVMWMLGIVISSPCQDLKTLETKIQNTAINDLKSVRKLANKIYRLDHYNEIATLYLVEAFNYTRQFDSIPLLFNKLKSINPQSPIPYFLCAKYQFQVFSLADTSRINELNKAVALDDNYLDAHYLLGFCYYELFHQKQTHFYATKSREHLLKATQIKKFTSISLGYPIIQTSYFLKDSLFIASFESQVIKPTTDSLNIPANGTWYYPLYCFLNMSENWKTDFTVNTAQHVGIAKFHLDWYSKHLSALKEPLIYNQKNKTIFRFTWLRTFHKPIAIRIEKVGDSYTIYWKQTNEAGGYEPGELIINDHKTMSKEQWDQFISLLQSTDFWNMSTTKDEMGHDGSRWIIEGLENGKYHVVNRWTPRNNNFQKCGLYLLDLSGLMVKSNEKY